MSEHDKADTIDVQLYSRNVFQLIAIAYMKLNIELKIFFQSNGKLKGILQNLRHSTFHQDVITAKFTFYTKVPITTQESYDAAQLKQPISPRHCAT